MKEYFDSIEAGFENRNKEKIESKYWDLRTQLNYCQLFLDYNGKIGKNKELMNGIYNIVINMLKDKVC